MIAFTEKLKVLKAIYSVIHRMPYEQAKLALLNPADCVRYMEFATLLKLLKAKKLNNLQVLDVGSPFVLSYVLSSSNCVTKTDIDEDVNSCIRPSTNLVFKKEDAIDMTFADDSFDLTYSISVIEHIYDLYPRALLEMIRVTRPGGFIYVTFPVSARHSEEWSEYPLYPSQHHKNRKYFFQYRFDKEDVLNLLAGLTDIEILEMPVYWEKIDGGFDRAMTWLLKEWRPSMLNVLKNSWINLYYGFCLLNPMQAGFEQPKEFGNMSLLLRKSQGKS